MDINREKKFCPFTQGYCRSDCMLLWPSQDSISESKKCALAIIAHQLQLLSEKEDKKKF